VLRCPQVDTPPRPEPEPQAEAVEVAREGAQRAAARLADANRVVLARGARVAPRVVVAGAVGVGAELGGGKALAVRERPSRGRVCH
jgi:hypothetical protein